MKRIWVGIGLLAAVLVSSLWAGHFMEKNHMPMAEDLDRAAQLALEEQWDGAESLTARARENWEKKRSFSACFAEHEPLDEIDGLFAQLEVYASARDEVSYSGNCVYLAQKLRALSKCHKFTLWNLM